MIFSVWGKDIFTPKDVPHGYEVSETLKSYGFTDGDIPLKVNGKALDNTFAINKMILTRLTDTSLPLPYPIAYACRYSAMTAHLFLSTSAVLLRLIQLWLGLPLKRRVFSREIVW